LELAKECVFSQIKHHKFRSDSWKSFLIGMPKHLFLLRHAESANKQLGQSDKERELTPKGIKESMLAGSYLLKSAVKFDVIISSTAARTRSTTQIVSDAMRSDPDKIIYEDQLYDASMRSFLEIINSLDDHFNYVMCVGHNPTISYLAEFLTNAQFGEMATGGLANIKFDITAWNKVTKGIGELVYYISPSMIQHN
jgi:phosphohistidine phosphatase